MKRFSLFLPVFALLFLLSCKSVEKEPVEEPIPSSSLNVMVVMHPVKDFDAWKPRYMAADSFKRAYGLTHFVLGRGIEDPNQLLVANTMTDVQKAKEFGNLPELKAAMDSSGVSGPPTFHYINLVRLDSTRHEHKERVIVWHRVKDYDTWLKAFDKEGRKMRMEHGLVDRAIGRSVDDPNMVYVVMNVSDMAKAKARVTSEDLKKIMTDGGVEGQPQSFWYTVVD